MEQTTMTDHDLTELLKMAREAEAFAQPAAPRLAPPLVHAPARASTKPDPYRILGWSSAGLAAAAAVAAAVVLFRIGPAPTINTDPNADTLVAQVPTADHTTAVGPVVAPEATVIPAALAVATPLATQPHEGRESIIVAMFRTADGQSRCVRIKSHEWDCGRSLDDISEGDLIGFAFENACDSVIEEGPESLVVLAMSGPKGSFAKEAETAEAIAACMQSTPDSCGIEAACYADVALQCLPPGITVRAETLAVR